MSYKYPAWAQMENALIDYQDARADHLRSEASKLGADGNLQLRRFNEAADALVRGAKDLTGVDAVACLTEVARSSDFQQGKPFQLMDEHICIEFGFEALDLLETARGRFQDLLVFVRDRQPCERARAFLQRVARCYLFGFDAECVVMCRAVLDRAFNESGVDDDDVSAWWNWYVTTAEGSKHKGKKPPYGTLWAKIHAAEYAKMIGPQVRMAGDTVRERGNDGVHKKPDEGDALEAVRQTVQVLDALEKTVR